MGPLRCWAQAVQHLADWGRITSPHVLSASVTAPSTIKHGRVWRSDFLRFPLLALTLDALCQCTLLANRVFIVRDPAC